MTRRYSSMRATLLALSIAPLGAQTQPPVPLGPLGGTPESVVIDPSNPDVMLIIKYTVGLFRSPTAHEWGPRAGQGACVLDPAGEDATQVLAAVDATLAEA